jgi:maltose alpha-D-glucosyltransferase/alpha-amylase
MARVGGDARLAALGAVLLLTLPGTPVVYYGDEIGMGSGTAVVVDARDASRTPMAWTGGPGAGFTTGTPWIALAPGADTANVAAQDGVAGSLLTLHRQLIAMRNRLDIFGTGTLTVVPTDADPAKVLVFVRSDGTASALVATSFSDQQQAVTFDASQAVTTATRPEVFLTRPEPLSPANAQAYTVTLPPFGYVVWTTDRAAR